MADELVPANAKSLYTISADDAQRELAEIREQVRESPDSIEEEQVLIRYLLRQAGKAGDPHMMGSLADLSAKLAKEARLGATARSEYVLRTVARRFMGDVVGIIADAFRDLCTDDDFARRFDAIIARLDSEWEVVRNSFDEIERIHGRHVSEMR
jgi:hypothetical protein